MNFLKYKKDDETTFFVNMDHVKSMCYFEKAKILLLAYRGENITDKINVDNGIISQLNNMGVQL